MNKKTLIVLIFIVLLLIVILSLFFFVFFIQPKKMTTPDKNLINANLTQTPIAKYTANFQISGENPQELKIVLDNAPEKGITGMQIFLKINPALKSPLKITDILETLPPPWKYVRKEFFDNNEIDIEAIYLKSGDAGDTSKEFVFAKINFPTNKESLDLSLDLEKSRLLTKQSGLEISFDNKIYSK